MAYVNSPLDLARMIAGMSYAGLLDVAREIVAMNEPDAGGDRDVKTKHGMADTLADWADAVIEDAEIEERNRKAAQVKAIA